MFLWLEKTLKRHPVGDPHRQHYRKQANDVIRLTVSRIREEQQRMMHLQTGSAEYVECEMTLADLKHSLAAMLALRKSTGR
jgi:hypothetical protein